MIFYIVVVVIFRYNTHNPQYPHLEIGEDVIHDQMKHRVMKIWDVVRCLYQNDLSASKQVKA